MPRTRTSQGISKSKPMATTESMQVSITQLRQTKANCCCSSRVAIWGTKRFGLRPRTFAALLRKPDDRLKQECATASSAPDRLNFAPGARTDLEQSSSQKYWPPHFFHD